MERIRIVDYRPEHQPYWERFNRTWIEELFEMEPTDYWTLENPDKAILQPGGAILMAEYDGMPAGTVGLRKVNDDTFEFTKMAVDPNFRRRGIAERLSYASFRKAKTLGAKKIILYSNKRNAAAVLMYEKIGFRHLDVEPGVYVRADVKMSIDIDTALQAADEFDHQFKT
jgi:ribosomal protein S18 acetylase RimI-like enzyme